ncbi:uncharacterized protein [Drosophila kikkawai]|uniref:Uncharacterized protein LOC108075793 n=1 Tax=Drosophila kikkawai TaxID=30033 RepID=A0A6P4I4K1_DROKI|nr:uncharacterized protein LOC108075793 [Drosophila kikkawai]XP_017023852.1 uncharacterized protein LOC108075793 [Drosophila kikkawai]
MANRNVPATPSQEELREKVNIKNVKNSEERETDNSNTNVDTDSLPSVSSAGAVSRGAVSTIRSQTKIPGPISLGPSSSTFKLTSRKYTSVLDVNRLRQQSANDSGIQMDSSMSDAEATAMTPIPAPVPSSRSEMELKLAEEQTLKELQRVVAEMEAEVALADKEYAELDLLDSSKFDQTSLSSDVEPRRELDDLQANEDKSAPIEALLADETEQGLAQKQASDDVQKIEATAQVEGALAAPEASQKLSPDGTQINSEKCGQEHPLAGTITNEVAQDNQQMLKKLTQLEEPEPEKNLLEPIPQGSVEKFPQIVLEEPSRGSVEAHLQQAFANVNQAQEQVTPEEPGDALNEASGEQTDAVSENLLSEAEPGIGELDLATTSESGLVTQPSQTNSHTEDPLDSNRNVITLEDLLRNASNVELLRRLLQIGAEANMVEPEPDFATQESSAEDKEETESVPETSTTSGTATGTEASTDEDGELGNDDEDEDGTDVSSQGLNKATVSLVWRLLSGKMLHLACPILFCGFAAGLIYMSRK